MRHYSECLNREDKQDRHGCGKQCNSLAGKRQLDCLFRRGDKSKNPLYDA